MALAEQVWPSGLRSWGLQRSLSLAVGTERYCPGGERIFNNFPWVDGNQRRDEVWIFHLGDILDRDVRMDDGGESQ